MKSLLVASVVCLIASVAVGSWTWTIQRKLDHAQKLAAGVIHPDGSRVTEIERKKRDRDWDIEIVKTDQGEWSVAIDGHKMPVDRWNGMRLALECSLRDRDCAYLEAGYAGIPDTLHAFFNDGTDAVVFTHYRWDGLADVISYAEVKP